MKKMWLVLLLLWPSLCCAQSLWLNLHAKGKNVEITAVKVGNFRVRPTSPELENSVQEGWKVVAKDAFGKALAHTVLVDERHVNEESFEQNGTIRSVADTHRTEGDVEGIVPFGPTLAKIEIFRIDAGKGITAGNASSNPVAVLDRQAIERIRDRTARSAVSSKPDPVVSLSSNRKARSGRKPMVIVFVGEGYTGPEMGAYRSAVDKAVATILSSYVFDAVKDDIGLERIDHVSAVSGHPSPGCDMCITTARQRAIANEALGVDGYDVLVDLVNANGRAHAIVGSGALVAFSGDLYSTNPNSIVHELGHALFGLDDEYAKGACASTMEPNTPNTTLEKDPAKIKWRQLITPGTPVPTTTGNLPPGTIGLYPVEPTCPDRGKYKPILGSMMNVNLDEWGAVNLQQILKVYAVYFGDVGNIVFPLEVKIKEMGENPPKTHNKGDAVTLMAGSQSLPDPSASPLTYTWKIPPQIQAQVDGRTIHFTIPVSGALAEYAFEATASDGKRSGSAAEVVKVNGGIAVPKAVLAGPSSVRAGQTFTYGGGGSQGGPLTYTWSLPGFTIVDASRPVERKVTAPSTPGIYEVQMTVRNNAGLTDTATHRQVVTESNAEGEPITASLNVPKEVKAGDALWALVDARSATNKPLTYSWAWTSADTAPVGQKFVDLGPGGQNHKNLQAAIFGVDVPATISVTIRDGTHEKTLTEPVLIKAEAVKAEITAVSQVQVGGPLALSAANSKGTGLTFSWSAPGFTPSSAAGENVTLTAPATAGSRQVQLTARSANGVAGTATHTVEVSANVPLTAKLVAPTTVVSGSQVPVNALVTHAPGRTLTYTWVATTPGLSGTVGNTPSGAYTAAVVSKNTIASIRLDVSDGQTTVRTPWHDVTITPPGATQPPTGTVSGPSTLDAGAQGTFTVSATDPQGGALSYAWTKPANWSGTVGNTANVTLTAPNVAQDANVTVAVTVTNAAGKTLGLSHAVTVKAPAGEPITATLIVPATVKVGDALPVRVDAKSATDKRLSYTWYRTSAYFAGTIGNNPSGTYTATEAGAGTTSSVYVQISDGTNSYTTPRQSVTILANAGGGGTTCYPSWSSTQVYGTISSSSPAARVSYQGRNYEQQHWTQNQNPAQLNGVGQPWKDLGPCQ